MIHLVTSFGEGIYLKLSNLSRQLEWTIVKDYAVVHYTHFLQVAKKHRENIKFCFITTTWCWHLLLIDSIVKGDARIYA